MICENGGTCFSAVDQPHCICVHGYTGDHCQDANPCLSQPCLNGGWCENDMYGDFECQCLPNYHGSRCEEFVNPCDELICENGGTCMAPTDYAYCSCPHGFIGARCQDALPTPAPSPCEASPCENNGICISLGEGYQCYCADGFSGPHCELDVSACLPNPCGEGVLCVGVPETEDPTDYICKCPTGVDCSIGGGNSPLTTTAKIIVGAGSGAVVILVVIVFAVVVALARRTSTGSSLKSAKQTESKVRM
ncbi:uncharacterized protein [Diadema antillarum]|uniref:uncharacterized protein n=1 Tax=Diadema antillarum TaxID=105358 RepID=UPI003A836D9B